MLQQYYLISNNVNTTMLTLLFIVVAHSNNDGAETFHDHQNETTVATGVNVKNLTFFVSPGKTKATVLNMRGVYRLL